MSSRPGRRGEVHGADVEAEDLGRPQDQGRVPDLIGGRQQDQPLSLPRQRTQAVYVLVLDAPGQISRIGKREPAGEFGCTQALVELEQGERIAVCLLDDPGPDALVERT